MRRMTIGKSSRGRLPCLLVAVLVFALSMLIASGVYAQSDRKAKKSSGKSASKRESPARKESAGNRGSSAQRNTESDRPARSAGPAREKRESSGSRARGESSRSKDRATGGRTGESRRETRSRETNGSDDRSIRSGDHSTSRGDGTSTRKRAENRSGDRTVRKRKIVIPGRYRRTGRGEDGDKESGDRKKKKINPGFGKNYKKDGGKKHIIIPPRPGRYDPPPSPEVYIDIDIWDPIPPPFVLPHLWYPPPNRDRYYIEGEEYVIHLPAGIIEPDGLDQAFIERIEYLRSIGRGDSFLVCLFQTEDPISDEDVRYLFEQGVTFYRFLSSHTAIIDISVEDISLLLMGMPNFRWIDEYRAEYKYRHDPPESNRRGAYIHSLVGDSIEFRNALKHIGISVIMYYEETEDYYAVADWDHFHEIAGLWWVEKVYKEPDTFSGVFAGE